MTRANLAVLGFAVLGAIAWDVAAYGFGVGLGTPESLGTQLLIQAVGLLVFVAACPRRSR